MSIFKNLFRIKRATNADLASPIVKRLKEEFAILHDIDFERAFRADPTFDRVTEERVIWRELVDLELQELDEQNSRRAQQSGCRSSTEL